MALSLSGRATMVAQSEIRNMTLECVKRGGVNLSQGVCDLDVPPAVLQGAKEAMDKGVNTYTRFDGRHELRSAVAEKYRGSGLDPDPERSVVVSCGATGAFHCTAMALLEPGDEVILLEPCYGYHAVTLHSAGAVPVFVPLNPADFSLDAEALENAVTSRTRGIMVNTPANPAGRVFTKDELDTLADFAVSHDLFVFTDEIYEHFVYGGHTHISPATLPGMRERTITISGFSKIFSITGWRLGYVVCDEKWSAAIGHFNDLLYVCAPAPLQIGAARGLQELDSDYYRSVALDHRNKRDRFCRALNTAGLTPRIPEGAYYVLADLSPLPGKTGKDKAMHLLEHTGIACVPGKAFYFSDSAAEERESLGRFCFAKKNDILNDAINRLQRM